MKSKEEFNLSEKWKNMPTEKEHNPDGECISWEYESYYLEKDVKEAVRLLKEKIRSYRTATYNMKFLKELDREIDKIFGDKLI